MNSKQLIAKLKAFPLAISLIVAAIVLSGWTYWRSTGALVDAQDGFDKVSQQNELISKNSKEGELLKEQLDELNADATKLTTGLINPVEDITNQQYFYDLEQKADVEQISDPVHTATIRNKDPAYPTVSTFTLSVDGHWDNLITFLYSLQTGPHPMRVTLFQITKAQQVRTTALTALTASDGNRLNLNLAVEILGK